MYTVSTLKKLNAQTAADEKARLATSYTTLQDGGLLIRHKGIARIRTPEETPALLTRIRAAKTTRATTKVLVDAWHGLI